METNEQVGFDRHEHWEQIYRTKDIEQKSWFQPKPETSLDFFERLNVSKQAAIIDVGGGNSLLVDHLLDDGYEDITVLDISETAIQKAKDRLGERAEKVRWITSDVMEFKPERAYDVWHDRAAFHFLNDEDEIGKYIDLAGRGIAPGGYLVMGTFSTEGPDQCSGLNVHQYSEKKMTELWSGEFEKIECRSVNHTTPAGETQRFLFCSFERKE